MRHDEPVAITVDGVRLTTAPGVSVAAALLNAGIREFRGSVAGEPRAPVCGMGICWECRVTIDGRAHVRACMTPVAEGMTVSTTFRDR